MKIGLLLVACLIPAICNAASGCKTLEYARLKDSTKSELVEEYCYSEAMWKMYGKSLDAAKSDIDAAHANMQVATNEISWMRELNAARASCGVASDDAYRMLVKKYHIKSPNCSKFKAPQ